MRERLLRVLRLRRVLLRRDVLREQADRLVQLRELVLDLPLLVRRRLQARLKLAHDLRVQHRLAPLALLVLRDRVEALDQHRFAVGARAQSAGRLGAAVPGALRSAGDVVLELQLDAPALAAVLRQQQVALRVRRLLDRAALLRVARALHRAARARRRLVLGHQDLARRHRLAQLQTRARVLVLQEDVLVVLREAQVDVDVAALGAGLLLAHVARVFGLGRALAADLREPAALHGTAQRERPSALLVTDAAARNEQTARALLEVELLLELEQVAVVHVLELLVVEEQVRRHPREHEVLLHVELVLRAEERDVLLHVLVDHLRVRVDALHVPPELRLALLQMRLTPLDHRVPVRRQVQHRTLPDVVVALRARHAPALENIVLPVEGQAVPQEAELLEVLLVQPQQVQEVVAPNHEQRRKVLAPNVHPALIVREELQRPEVVPLRLVRK